MRTATLSLTSNLSLPPFLRPFDADATNPLPPCTPNHPNHTHLSTASNPNSDTTFLLSLLPIVGGMKSKGCSGLLVITSARFSLRPCDDGGCVCCAQSLLGARHFVTRVCVTHWCALVSLPSPLSQRPASVSQQTDVQLSACKRTAEHLCARVCVLFQTHTWLRKLPNSRR